MTDSGEFESDGNWSKRSPNKLLSGSITSSTIKSHRVQGN